MIDIVVLAWEDARAPDTTTRTMGSNGSRHRNRRAKHKSVGRSCVGGGSSCIGGDAYGATSSADHLYNHDDELCEKVCAVAVVRSVGANLLLDANDWYARVEAADEVAEESERETAHKGGKAKRLGEPTPQSRLEEARHPREKDMLERIASESNADGGISMPSLRDSVVLEKLQRDFGSTVKQNAKSVGDSIKAWRGRVLKMHQDVQASYEKTLESALTEHERTWNSHAAAEKRFHRLTALKSKKQQEDDTLEHQKEIDAVNTEINALVAQLEKLEDLIKIRCDDFTSYYVPQLTYAIRLYSVSQIDKLEACNEAVALAASTNIDTLREELEDMHLPSKVALESPPTPPRMRTSKRRQKTGALIAASASSSPNVQEPSSEDELEEGEIRDDEPSTVPAKQGHEVDVIASSAAAA